MKEFQIVYMEMGFHSTRYLEAGLNDLLTRNRYKRKLQISKVDFDFDRINELLPDGKQEIMCELKSIARTREVVKSDYFILPNITLQFYAYDIFRKLNLVNVYDLLTNHILSSNFREIKLIGSKFTMTKGPISCFFEERGIRVNFPDRKTIEEIDGIRKSIYESGLKGDTVDRFSGIIERVSGSDLKVIACSELSVAWDHCSKLGVVDMLDLQINDLEKTFK